tara:strand:+ start:3698 stop:4057 length:360 start_codon:yes stop_codon:yes gene_type:complete
MSSSSIHQNISNGLSDINNPINNPINNINNPINNAINNIIKKDEKVKKVKKVKKNKKRKCNVCKKKLGLIPFKCKCEKMFCSLHRYAEDHQCPYDYKTEGINKIIKDNPKVVAEKIIRI